MGSMGCQICPCGVGIQKIKKPLKGAGKGITVVKVN